MAAELSYFIIVNPTAGRGRGSNLVPHIESFFRAHRIAHELCVTEKRGHATALARAGSLAGWQTVVAVGGDGTVNEVANGLVGSSAALGVIPCGVGNDFARTFSLPADWKKACRVLIQPKVEMIDVASANGRCFLNSAGVGFDAAVALEVASSKTRVGGIWPYLFAVLRTLPRFKRDEIEMSFDGNRISVRAWLVAITNGPTYGGGMRICPQARTDDGFLDFCVIGDIAIGRVFYYLPLVIMGRHEGLPEIYTGKATSIKLKMPASYCYHLEGEVMRCSELEISVQPRALKVITGRREEPS